jgi:hypothetical protein
MKNFHNTGKVKIGIAYEPRNPHMDDVESRFWQGVMLKDKRYGQSVVSVGVFMAIVAAIIMLLMGAIK